MRFDRATGACALLVLLSACDGCPTTRKESRHDDRAAAAGAEIVEAQWTIATARRMEALTARREASYALPEVRAYDGKKRLLVDARGFEPGHFAQTISSARKVDKVVPGPSYSATLAEIETADHVTQMALQDAHGGLTVFDYWASWCVPCKKLDRELRFWAAKEPRGSVRIVRVEADITRLTKAHGGKAYLLKRGADGKLRKVEI